MSVCPARNHSLSGRRVNGASVSPPHRCTISVACSRRCRSGNRRCRHGRTQTAAAQITPIAAMDRTESGNHSANSAGQEIDVARQLAAHGPQGVQQRRVGAEGQVSGRLVDPERCHAVGKREQQRAPASRSTAEGLDSGSPLKGKSSRRAIRATATRPVTIAAA